MKTQFQSVTPVFIVNDPQQAKTFYLEKLGFELSFEWGDPLVYCGVCRGNVEIHLNSVANAPHAAGQSELMIITDEVDELYAQCVAQGVEITIHPGDREYGLRDFGVRDTDGNVLNFACELS